ncbi:DUF397 domain-containing protein [Streptomyces sp. NPDC006365]|uniref:DUF397 domain-containing protein n=1 Tax=Streptomyces sp. NPDC006365 TaxID=3364744 RepID=UPI00367BAB31
MRTHAPGVGAVRDEVHAAASFSGGGEGECVELAATTPDRIHLRESDHPHKIATTTPHPLANQR